MAAKQVKKNAREADIAERTLKRAKAALGIRSEKESDGSWTWSLPPKLAEGGQTSTDGSLGTVGKDANPEPEDSAYLREEGQGGQGGQVLGTEEAWPSWQEEYPEHREDCLCD